MSFTPTGWVCPKCGKVWSPTSDQCWTCNHPTAHPVFHTNTGSDVPEKVTRWVVQVSKSTIFDLIAIEPSEEWKQSLDTCYPIEIFPGRKE